jgi:hypothetical protein
VPAGRIRLRRRDRRLRRKDAQAVDS